jgi:hypothetical protein
MATPGRGAVTSRNQRYRIGMLFGGLVTKEWLIMKKPMVFYYPALFQIWLRITPCHKKVENDPHYLQDNGKPYHGSHDAFYVRTNVKVCDFKSYTNPIITL